MSLDRRSRKILLWISRGANGVAITVGVYIGFNWDITTVEDVLIAATFIMIGAVTKSFSI